MVSARDKFKRVRANAERIKSQDPARYQKMRIKSTADKQKAQRTKILNIELNKQNRRAIELQNSLKNIGYNTKSNFQFINASKILENKTNLIRATQNYGDKELSTWASSLVKAAESANQSGQQYVQVGTSPFAINDTRFASMLSNQQKLQNAINQINQAPPSSSQVTSAIQSAVGKYRVYESRLSGKIPSLKQIENAGRNYARNNPSSAKKIVTAFQAVGIGVQTQLKLSNQERAFVKGIVDGSYSSLQQKPLKTLAMFGVGLVTGPAGKIGKGVMSAAKVGKFAPATGKVVGGAIGATYVGSTAKNIYDAPSSYEKGLVLSDAVFTELLPAMAGAGLYATATPKIKANIINAKTKYHGFKIDKALQKAVKANEKQRLAQYSNKRAMEESYKKFVIKQMEKWDKARVAQMSKLPKKQFEYTMHKEFFEFMEPVGNYQIRLQRGDYTIIAKGIKSGKLKPPSPSTKPPSTIRKMMKDTRGEVKVKTIEKEMLQLGEVKAKPIENEILKVAKIKKSVLFDKPQKTTLSDLIKSNQKPEALSKNSESFLKDMGVILGIFSMSSAALAGSIAPAPSTTQTPKVQPLSKINTLPITKTTIAPTTQIRTKTRTQTQTPTKGTTKSKPTKKPIKRTTTKPKRPPIPLPIPQAGKTKKKGRRIKKIKRRTSLSDTQIKNSVATINSIFG